MKLFRTTGDTTAEDEKAQGEKGDTAMSQYPAAQADDEQSAPAAGTASYPAADTSTDQPRPTFTPAADGPPAAADTAVGTPATTVTRTGTAFAQEPFLADDAPVMDGTAAADEPPAMDESRTAYAADEPVTASPAAPASPYVPAAASPAAPASPAYEPAAALPVDEPAAAFMADEPLLSNTTGMRASWQKVQAEFVDDPQAAVINAADLIEQTAQSLVEALQQRQLRVLSDGGGVTAGNGSGSAASSGAPDTEHLRLMMKRYRTLFDQLCNA